MLVLTRKTEEKIVIGDKDKIIITILKVQGGKVSIGIQADKKWQIVREELLDEETQNEIPCKTSTSQYNEEESDKEENDKEEMMELEELLDEETQNKKPCKTSSSHYDEEETMELIGASPE